VSNFDYVTVLCIRIYFETLEDGKVENSESASPGHRMGRKMLGQNCGQKTANILWIFWWELP
jgi:hypothetical protein